MKTKTPVPQTKQRALFKKKLAHASVKDFTLKEIAQCVKLYAMLDANDTGDKATMEVSKKVTTKKVKEASEKAA